MGQNPSEPVAAIPQSSAAEKDTVHSRPSAGPDVGHPTGMEKELMDLRILNRGKDYFIEQLQQERTAMLEKLVSGSHRIGELESHSRQLAAHRKGGENSIESSGRSFDAR